MQIQRESKAIQCRAFVLCLGRAFSFVRPACRSNGRAKPSNVVLLSFVLAGHSPSFDLHADPTGEQSHPMSCFCPLSWQGILLRWTCMQIQRESKAIQCRAFVLCLGRAFSFVGPAC